MPTAWAAIPMRPPSSVSMAILNPSPSSPRRFASGTRQSSRKTWVVVDVPLGTRLHVSGVAAGARLAQTIRPDRLPAGQGRKKTAALLIGAELVDRLADQRDVDGQDHRMRRAGSRHLLHR